MNTFQIETSIVSLEQSDPVAELAKRIIDSGVSEDGLCQILENLIVCDPLKVELHNKYRDLTIVGCTHNRYGRKWQRK